MHKPTPAAATMGQRAFAPVALAGSSRLTFRRLRRPTPLPTIPSLATLGGFSGYLGRLNWLFGGR